MAKIKDNHRVRKQRKRRGNSRFILLFLGMVLLLITIITGFSHVIKHLSWFDIRRIVVSGNVNLEDTFLQELAAEFIGTNLYSIPLKNVSYKYENIVRIKRLRVRRVFPNRLKLIVNERVGFVYIKTAEGSLVPIDIEKTILDRKGFYLKEDLPVVHTNISVRELNTGDVLENSFVDKICEIHKMILSSNISESSISEYYQHNNDLFLIELNTGSRICLGRDNYPEKLQKLEFVFENIGIERLSFLDLKFADQIVIRSGGR